MALKILFFLLFATSILTTLKCDNEEHPSRNLAEETFKFLQEGDLKIKLEDDQKDAILLLGMTGSGKSTLVKFLSGDGNDLFGVRKGREWILSDGGKNIGTRTIVSKTLIPEITIDNETNKTFVDCAGFGDTRSVSTEIAASYYIKKVISEAENIKMVFTIIHSAVRTGNDREGVLKWLTNILELIHDIDKYENSMSIIITKFESDPMLTDEEEIDYIKEYFMEVKLDLESKILDTKLVKEEKQLTLSKIKLLNIILNGNKIGIFKRPNQKGPVSQSILLHNNKLELRELIFNNSTFSPKDDSDFKYPLSDNAKLHIKENLFDSVDANVIKILDNINSNLILTFNENGENQVGHKEYFNQLSTSYNELATAFSKIHKSDGLKLYLISAIKYITTTNLNSSYIDIMKGTVDQSEFFRSLITDVRENHIEKYVNVAKDAPLYIEYLCNCYYIIDVMQDNLGKYHNQKIIKSKSILEYKITENSFVGFLEIITQSFPSLDIEQSKKSIQSMKSIPNQFILRDFNEIVEFCKKINYTCVNNQLKIVGNYIFLSDYLKNNNPLCKTQNLKKLTIHAMNTVFIDVDIDIKELKLIIIAPNWEIIGKRVLKLDGKPGEKFTTPAKNGVKGINGANGMPGNVGHIGGDFVGVASVIVNSANLTVQSNGGSGGAGQIGGRGYNGENSRYPIETRYYEKGLKKFDNLYSDIRSRGYTYEVHKYKKSKIHTSVITYNAVHHFYNLKITNSQPVPPTNGGHGGKGGTGGLAGNVILLSMNPIQVKFNKNKGPVGAGGKGGTGGIGAHAKATLQYDCEDKTQTHMVIAIPVYIKTEYTCNYIGPKYTHDKMKDAMKGKDGFFTLVRKAQVLNPIPLKQILIGYSDFAKNMHNILIHKNLVDTFLSYVNNNKK